MLLIGVQGLLGGLTVTQLLRFDIVTAHLGTALLFFSSMLAIGTLLLLPYKSTGTVGRLPWVGLGAVVLVYFQCLLGGWSGLAGCPPVFWPEGIVPGHEQSFAGHRACFHCGAWAYPDGLAHPCPDLPFCAGWGIGPVYVWRFNWCWALPPFA